MSAAEERQQETLQYLGDRGEVSIAELSIRFGVSEMTVRRDLNQLAAEGLLLRTHGGASRSNSGSFEPPFALRTKMNQDAKRRIAERVSLEIKDGQTIVLDGGSTGVAVAQALVGRSITVCALNLRVAEILAQNSATQMLIPGGTIRPGELSIVGSEAEAMFSRYRFDAFVMTASGLDAVGGVTEWNVDDAAIKRAAVRGSHSLIVAADSSKFGQVAFAKVCELAAIDLLVSDRGLSENALSVLRECSTKVEVT